MKIIYDPVELEGTCYFEILPGQYLGKCWNENSIFLEEEVFGYLEPSIQKAFSEFDHNGFHSIDIDIWNKIILNFEEVKHLLLHESEIDQIDKYIGFIYQNSKMNFVEKFAENSKNLIKLIDELIIWINQTSKEYEQISILGI